MNGSLQLLLARVGSTRELGDLERSTVIQLERSSEEERDEAGEVLVRSQDFIPQRAD